MVLQSRLQTEWQKEYVFENRGIEPGTPSTEVSVTASSISVNKNFRDSEWDFWMYSKTIIHKKMLTRHIEFIWADRIIDVDHPNSGIEGRPLCSWLYMLFRIKDWAGCYSHLNKYWFVLGLSPDKPLDWWFIGKGRGLHFDGSHQGELRFTATQESPGISLGTSRLISEGYLAISLFKISKTSPF